MSTTHIVLTAGAAGSLRDALRTAGRHDKVVEATDTLSYGPIDPPDPRARLDWMVNELGLPRSEWDWLPESDDKFWGPALAPARRKVIWVSRRSANEYAGFLEFIRRIGNAPCQVVDLTDVIVARTTADGEIRRDATLDLGWLRADLIARDKLWDLAKPLEVAERTAHQEAWRGLQRENAPLRVITSSGLVSAPLTTFDEALLSHATEDWERAPRLVAAVMAEALHEFAPIDAIVLLSRLVSLGRAGQLEFKRAPAEEADEEGMRFGLSGWLQDAEVRLPRK